MRRNRRYAGILKGSMSAALWQPCTRRRNCELDSEDRNRTYLSLEEELRCRICLAVSTLTAPSLSLKGDSHTEDRVCYLSGRYLCAVSEWISLVACGGDIWP